MKKNYSLIHLYSVVYFNLTSVVHMEIEFQKQPTDVLK